jgi:invasion protein IalB
MTRGKIMSHHTCGYRVAITLRAIVAGSVVLAGAASAQQQAPPPQQQAPAAKPPAASKPPAPKQGTAAAPAAPAPPGAPQPTLLGLYGEWGAYTANPGGKKICFVLAKPTNSSTSPPNRPRDPAYMFVSTRPAEKVKDEVSVIFGYGLKPNSDANIEVAGGGYAMYTQGDGGWVKNAAEEPKLVETMRKGQNLTVKGTSSKGTVSTDIYSLKGLASALDRIAQECR